MPINLLTTVKILDNSGALEAKCIKPNRNNGLIGHSIPIIITKTRPNCKIKLGKVIRAYIVWTKAQQGAINGIILLRTNSQFWGTRLRYPLPRSLRSQVQLWPLGPSWI